jgi:hypothetical protein
MQSNTKIRLTSSTRKKEAMSVTTKQGIILHPIRLVFVHFRRYNVGMNGLKGFLATNETAAVVVGKECMHQRLVHN